MTVSRNNNLRILQKTWNTFGKQDPLWAIVTCPEKKGQKWDMQEFMELGRKDVDSLIEYLQSLKITVVRSKALDFGCGVGRLTQALARYFEEVAGVDIAPSMIKKAKRYNQFGEQCKYYLNERDDLCLFSDNTFDFIYTWLVLQHMRPEFARSYIKEFVRILRPGGVVVFQLPGARKEVPHHASFDRKGPVQSDTAISGIKRIIRSALPARALRAYYAIWYREEPEMEMHGIKREEVIDLLITSGAQVVDVQNHPDAGREWVSFRYCAVKPT